MDPKLMMEDKPKMEGNIRTMPKKYLPAQKKNTSFGTYFIIGLVILLVLIIITMGVLFFMNSNATPEVATEPVDSTSVEEQEDVSQTEPEPIEEETIDPIEEEEDTLRVEIPLINQQTTPAPDNDQDALSDLEEAIFVTSNAVPDTDADGFLDGSEVLNLYDPAEAGALLEASPQIKIARNTGQNYQFLIPTDWTSTSNTPRGEELMIRPSGDAEDLFVIQVYDNPDRLEVTDWYREQVDLPNLAGFKNFSNPAGWTGIQSRDNLVIIATFGEDGPGARAYIYVMEYRLGSDSVINYPSIWNMIVNSLDILEIEPEETP